ncbi:ribbon-helix-helix domain-containing protein [Spirosoma linguale]
MAAEKKAFVLRIQPETLKELERWAQEEFRSVNGQIEFLLNDALRKRKKRNTKVEEGGGSIRSEE